MESLVLLFVALLLLEHFGCFDTEYGSFDTEYGSFDTHYGSFDTHFESFDTHFEIFDSRFGCTIDWLQSEVSQPTPAY